MPTPMNAELLKNPGVAVESADQPSGGDPTTLGCFSVSLIVLVAGIALLVARPSNWKIPGVVVFIVIGLAWAGVSVTRKEAFGQRRRYTCGNCGKPMTVRAAATGPVTCPHCKEAMTLVRGTFVGRPPAVAPHLPFSSARRVQP